jgi:hypothetical protein
MDLYPFDVQVCTVELSLDDKQKKTVRQNIYFNLPF